MWKKSLIALSLFLIGGFAFGENIVSTAINWPAQAVNTTQTIQVESYDRFSMQAVYEDASPSADTVSDGVTASVTITLPGTMTNLIGAAASGTVNVLSSSTVSGDSIVVNGHQYTEGVHWTAETSSSTSASNLATAANIHPDVSATASGSTVTLTARSLGLAGNSYTLTTTDAVNLVRSGANFSGGLDAPSVNVNGTILTEDTDFDFESSSSTSATDLADAIGNDATLGAVFSTGTSVNVITLTAKAPSSTRYFVSASTTGITVGNWTYGIDADIDIDGDVITQTDHGFTTGLGLLFANVSGTDPGGLTDQTTYYSIKLNEDRYQLASSTTNAVAGTDIDITGVTGSGSFTLTPLAFDAGSTGFTWEVSNDGSTWTDLAGTTVNGVTLSSVTYSADGDSVWDFGSLNYRYLRINFIAPDDGGLAVTATLNGKR